jgi:hypothetical protein
MQEGMRKIMQGFFYFLFSAQKYWFIMIHCVGGELIS